MDCIAKALRRAHQRAQSDGVELRLIKADVTRLRTADVGSGFRLLIDYGLFHDELTDAKRAAVGDEVSAVAAPGATLLMMGWSRRRRPLLPRRASRCDIEAAYPSWMVADEQPFDVSGAPFYRRIRHAEPRFYRLHHH